jgi:hypothetical protein
MPNVNFPQDEYWGVIPAVGPYAGAEQSLQMLHWNIAVWGGSRFGIPTLRGQDVEVPYRAGKQWRSKMPDSRTISMNMWTAGINQATGNPDLTDQRLTFDNNLQFLRALFYQRDVQGSRQVQLVRRWWLTQQGVNQIVLAKAMAEVAGSMEPTNLGRTSASFSVDMLLSDPYFYGVQRQQQLSGNGQIYAPGEGVVGEGYSSPVSMFTIALTTGPVTVTNSTAGVAFTYSGTIANPPLTIDVLNNTATDAQGNVLVSGITHTGARMWMALVEGSNAINVSAGTATFNWADAYI